MNISRKLKRLHGCLFACIITLVLLILPNSSLASGDLNINSGTYTLTAGNHSFNTIRIADPATLRIAGAANITCSRLEVNGTIILSGDASFFCTYGQDNPGTNEWTVFMGGSSNIHCDFHDDGDAANGQNGANGLDEGESGESGTDADDGHDGYNLAFIVIGHVILERVMPNTINLSGQNGGRGGSGGNGKKGDGDGLECILPGKGGDGGNAADGGNGGDGGNLTWVVHGGFRSGKYDSALNYNDAYLVWNVSGGNGGFAGVAGNSGYGGDSGSGCDPCQPGGNGGYPGQSANAGQGGRGGNIRINAQDMLGLHTEDSTGPIKANGGASGTGGRGGNGGFGGSGCSFGVSTQGSMHGAGRPGGAGGSIVITLSCELNTKLDWKDDQYVLSLQANGGMGGGCDDPGQPGFGQTVDQDPLDAQSISGAGGQGGALAVNAASINAVAFEAVGGQGGFGADGASYVLGVPGTIKGGDGADGAAGGVGGDVVVTAGWWNATAHVVDGGAGGTGGEGGHQSSSTDPLLYGDDGADGADGGTGTYNETVRDSDWFAAGLAVDTYNVDPGDVLTYTLAAISENAKTNVTLSATIPTGTTYVSGGALNGQTVSWTFNSLGACELGLGTLKVRVNRTALPGETIDCMAQATHGSDTTESETVTVKVGNGAPPTVLVPWLNILMF